jgi:hypothetical protein
MKTPSISIMVHLLNLAQQVCTHIESKAITTHFELNMNDIPLPSPPSPPPSGRESSDISPTQDDSEIEMFVDINGLPTDTYVCLKMV